MARKAEAIQSVHPAGLETAKALRSLMDIPAAISSAAAAAEAIDRCLHVGFGRLGPEQAAGLAGLAQVMAGTPLAESLGKALHALKANEFQPGYFAVLAAVRSALHGARYDALLAQLGDALGRTPGSAVSPGGGNGAPAAGNAALCESAQHWLMELAITGFKQLDVSSLAPFSATLENLQGEPSLARLACLLTGFQQELLAALPIGHDSTLPTCRWADLWSRGMVSALQARQGLGVSPAGEKVQGTLQVLGVDLRQSDCFASAVFYSVLETGSESRVVRVTLSSYKVDALQGREIWRCFAGDAAKATLLKAAAMHTPLKITGMTLLASGDLLWDGDASEAGKSLDVMALAAAALAPKATTRFPEVSPADRHPVQLGELVFLDGIKVQEQDGGSLVMLAEATVLPLAEDRLAGTDELSREDLLACSRMVGLLRFDAGRWMLQPLAVQPASEKKPEAFVGCSACDVLTRKPKKGEPNTLAVLQERASRLLRKKA